MNSAASIQTRPLVANTLRHTDNEAGTAEKGNCSRAKSNPLRQEENIIQKNLAHGQTDKVNVFNALTYLLVILFLCSLTATFTFESIMVIPTLILVGLLCFIEASSESINFHLEHSDHCACGELNLYNAEDVFKVI